MKKVTVGWMICLAVSFGLAATVLLAQSQSKKPEPNASAAATHAQAAAISARIAPLNMKTGLWQTTMTGKYSGLPPQIAAAMNPTHTYKNCLKPKDLDKNAWAKELAGYKCSSMTVLQSTASDIDVVGKDCEVGNGMTAEGHGKFHMADSGHLTGSMEVTFNGGSPLGGNGSVHMLANYTSNWIGATCPADLN